MVSCSTFSFISSSFSVISCTSWIFAQLPQIITNYKLKSAEGISPSFLLLWFLGDFLSFTSCLMNDAVLNFQLYLSIFFLCNDVTLCFQYYYYNSVYPRTVPSIYQPVVQVTSEEAADNKDVSIHNEGLVIKHKHNREHQSLNDGSASSSYDSTEESGSVLKNIAVAAVLNTGRASALSINSDSTNTAITSWGLVLAWGCTFVYCSSRCPQLYKNYKRKSVEGISPMLFGSALLGNLAYTLSILTSCAFVYGENRADFIYKELPYIIGSSGTIVFDAAYFYQKYLYRYSGRNTSVMSLEPWEEIEHSGRLQLAPSRSLFTGNRLCNGSRSAARSRLAIPKSASILDIPPDTTPHPLCSMETAKLESLTKRELRHLSAIDYESMEEKADACFTISTAISKLLPSNPKQASRIYHLLADAEMKSVIFKNVLDSLSHDERAKVYIRFIAEPVAYETHASFVKLLIEILKAVVTPKQKAKSLFDYLDGVAQTEMVNSQLIRLDTQIFRTMLDIVEERDHADLYSYLLQLNIRPKSKKVFEDFRRGLLTISPRSQFIANTGYISPKWYDLNQTKFNPVHTSRIIEFYSFPELHFIHNHYVLNGDPARASLFLNFMVTKLEREGKGELTEKPESFTKERVSVILKCVLNLIIRFKNVTSATQVLKFMKDENFHVEIESLVLLLRMLRQAKEYDQFITVLTGMQLADLKRNERNIVVDEILLLMRDKFRSSPKVIIGYPYESTIASKIISTHVVQPATVDDKLKNSNLTSRVLSYVYQVLFNSMDKNQRHDPAVIYKYFQLYVDFMSKNSLSEPDDKPLGVFLQFALYTNEESERHSIIPSGNYYLAKEIFEYYKSLNLNGNKISTSTLEKLSRVAITKFNDFTFATEVTRFAKDKGKMLTFHQIFPFIKKSDEEGDSRRFTFWMNELTKMGVKVTSRELNEFIEFCRDPEPAKSAYKYKWSMTKHRRENKKALDRLSADFLPTNGKGKAKVLQPSEEVVTEEIA
ncbi:hypothetical protein I9W82_001285 [Candida metapsilosis]|uniref:Uncharacterized protein n=1 Tax=Candida metapsilosis TaxID=273372 RepID=A0A8H7ZL27_9ASCO|nr:hypothetical protein I9W82_001285 [Candida metapsilosis]